MKKTLLSIGTLTAVAAPIVAAVSCSGKIDTSEIDGKFSTFNELFTRYRDVKFETRQINSEDGIDYMDNVFRDALFNGGHPKPEEWAQRRAQFVDELSQLELVGQIDTEDESETEFDIFRIPNVDKFNVGVQNLDKARDGALDEGAVNEIASAKANDYAQVSLWKEYLKTPKTQWREAIKYQLAYYKDNLPLIQMLASNRARGDLAENWDFYHLDGHNGWEWQYPQEHDGQRYIPFDQRTENLDTVQEAIDKIKAADAAKGIVKSDTAYELKEAMFEQYANKLEQGVRNTIASNHDNPLSKYALDEKQVSSEIIRNLSFSEIFNIPDQPAWIVIRLYKPDLRPAWSHSNPWVFGEICYIHNEIVKDQGAKVLHGSFKNAISFGNLTAR